MKIDYISDIHLNSWLRKYHKALQVKGLHTKKDALKEWLLLPATGIGDVAVVAGDNGNGMSYLPEVRQALYELGYEHVVVIPGNHDYYGEKYEPVRFTKEIDGVKFTAVTLWTSFLGSDESMRIAVDGINDFRSIIPLDRSLDPGNLMRLWNEADIRYLKDNSADVVVAHFLPLLESVSPKYAGASCTPYYANELSYLVYEQKPKLWIHGHSHHKQVYKFDETIVASNPIGYCGENQTAPVFEIKQVVI